MGILVGANWVIDLRLLGAASAVPLQPLTRLFRAMWVGFWLNFVTGLMLFTSDASTKGTTTVFFAKIALIIAAVIVAVLMKRTLTGRDAQSGVVPSAARVFAVLSIVLWLGAITTGRWMAYV
jgi:hypothetical protein